MTPMTTGEARASRHAKRQALVMAKQVETLYRHSAPVLLANVGNALILDVVLWNRASRPFLVAWTTLMLAMTAVRIELRRRYWQTDRASSAFRPWEVRFLIGTAVAGVLWGTAGWVLSTPGDASAQFLVAFVIAGMVAGAAGSLSCHLPAFFLYLFPATLPLFVRWLLEEDPVHFGMAAMLALFAGAFSLIARNVNRSIGEAFYLRSENLELLDRFRENELRLKDALLAKEDLLKEVHHRVKNNLQLLLSMLNLQADVVTDPPTIEIVRDIQDRLRSIATVHDRLSQSLDSGRIDLESYLRMLVHDLFRGHRAQSAALRHTVELPPIELGSNDVMLCGLVVNELVTNAIKHGFPDGRAGEVRVIGKDLGDHRLSIAVSDDGIGMPPGEPFASKASLGLQLVHVLAQQLNAKVDVSRGRGTKVELTFDVNR